MNARVEIGRLTDQNSVADSSVGHVANHPESGWLTYRMCLLRQNSAPIQTAFFGSEYCSQKVDFQRINDAIYVKTHK